MWVVKLDEKAIKVSRFASNIAIGRIINVHHNQPYEINTKREVYIIDKVIVVGHRLLIGNSLSSAEVLKGLIQICSIYKSSSCLRILFMRHMLRHSQKPNQNSHNDTGKLLVFTDSKLKYPI